jgi:hypothetical protein
MPTLSLQKTKQKNCQFFSLRDPFMINEWVSFILFDFFKKKWFDSFINITVRVNYDTETYDKGATCIGFSRCNRFR